MTLREGTTAELLDAVAAAELDLAFVALDARPLPPRGLTALQTYREELTVVVAPGHLLTAVDRIELEALTAYPFVDFQAGTGLQTTIESLFTAAGAHRHITFRVGSIDRVLELVRHGLGIAVVPDPPIALRSGLHRIHIHPEALSGPSHSWAGPPRVPPSMAAELFLELLGTP